MSTTILGTIHWTRPMSATPDNAPIVIDLTDDDNDCNDSSMMHDRSVFGSDLFEQSVEPKLDTKNLKKTRASPKHTRRYMLHQSAEHSPNFHRNNGNILETTRQEEQQIARRFQLAQQLLNKIKLELRQCHEQVKVTETKDDAIDHWQPRLPQVVFDIDEQDDQQSNHETCSKAETRAYEYEWSPIETCLGDVYSIDAPTVQELEFMASLPWEV